MGSSACCLKPTTLTIFNRSRIQYGRNAAKARALRTSDTFLKRKTFHLCFYYSTGCGKRQLLPCCLASSSAPRGGSAALSSYSNTLELSTKDTQYAVKFSSLLFGRGKAIVVETVVPGSSAEAAGVRPGQRLLALSDPIRLNEMWHLNDLASLRYVRDAVRMRSGDFILLELSAEPLPEWSGGSLASSSSQDVTSSDSEEEDLLSAIASATAQSSIRSEEDQDTPFSGSNGDGGLTVRERLQREYTPSSATTAAAAAVQQRVKRRKEYMNQVSERNDTPFFAGLLALFLLPALGILAVASSSGYLDALAAGWQ